MKRYIYEAYNPKYKLRFLREKTRLEKVLGKRNLIEHVGSTAVPGLGGKGIIEIMILAPKSKIQSYSRKLQRAGFLFRKNATSKPDRLFFRTDYEDKPMRKVHVHITYSKKELREKIAFREYMIAHPKDAHRYAEIKKKAVKFAKGEGERYRKYKEKFLSNITKKALKYSTNG